MKLRRLFRSLWAERKHCCRVCLLSAPSEIGKGEWIEKMKREGWYDPEEREFTVPVIMGPRTWYCNDCHALVSVGPVKNSSGRYWVYRGKCTNCGVTFENLYHAWRRPTTDEKSAKGRNVLPPEED